jgi:Meiotically up-regulated gene 113
MNPNEFNGINPNEFDRMRPYRQRRQKYSKYQPFDDLNHYVDFLESEEPFYYKKLIIGKKKILIKVFKGSYTLDYSLNFWAYISEAGLESEGQLVQVRYNYTYNKPIRKKVIYQWLPKTFWYKKHPEFGFTIFDVIPLISDSELLEIMEQCLETHRTEDYRFDKLDNIKCPTIFDLYEEKFSNIYLIQCELTRTIKIGRAKNPKHRFLQIDSDAPTPLRLIATIQSNYADILDELLKNHFDYKRAKKEWFFLNKNDVMRILTKQLPYPINEIIGEVTMFEELHERTPII